MNSEMIFGKFPVLESTNLILKKIEKADVKEVFAIYGAPSKACPPLTG